MIPLLSQLMAFIISRMSVGPAIGGVLYDVSNINIDVKYYSNTNYNFLTVG